VSVRKTTVQTTDHFMTSHMQRVRDAAQVLEMAPGKCRRIDEHFQTSFGCRFSNSAFLYFSMSIGVSRKALQRANDEKKQGKQTVKAGYLHFLNIMNNYYLLKN
jgi:hypothetical protein